jgi:hypothetical protein
MLPRRQQRGIDPGQPRQGLRIQPVVFLPALPDQAHVARMRHDHFVAQLTQHPAHPRRVHSGLQRHAAARHSAEHLAQSLGSRAQALLQQHATSFVEYALPTGAIAQVESDG